MTEPTEHRHAPETAVDANDRCGEAPIWDVGRRRLLRVDLSANLVHQFVPSTGEQSVISENLNVCGIAIDRSGGLVFGGAEGLLLWRGPGRIRTVVAEHGGQRLLFNDLVAGPGGRVYAGTLYWGANGMEKPGALYLIAPGGGVTVVDDGIQLANGLGFSPDDTTLYFADSAARCIYACDVDRLTGTLSRKRTFARVPAEWGIPDGLTVDSAGSVWCAMWYGGRVVRYDPDGTAQSQVRLPVSQVSSVGFGGDDLSHLYITTAAEPWPSEFAPPGFDVTASRAGGPLYRVRLGVPGKPEHLADFGNEPGKRDER